MIKLKIIVCGDTHGYWNTLNELIREEKPDILLQVGDFGYWEKIPQFSIKKIEPLNSKIYFCPGNHENWHLLNELKDNQLTEHIRYMPKGSTLRLPDGRNILFMGGADSVDKGWRTPGYDWFPEELINERDMGNLPNEDIDIVISHTCPLEFDMKSTYGTGEKLHDPSREYLSQILKRYKPKEWYFGHWHIFSHGVVKFNDNKECRWISLNECLSDNWWIEI